MGTGLYVHVPYCRHRCPYCDFNVWIDKRAPWDELARAIVADLERHAPRFPMPFDTVYFGGGTPSLAPASFVETILSAARGLGVRGEAEITMEIEPSTIERTALRARLALGVNRASLGWQSTHDRLLRTLGRMHDAQASARMAEDVSAAGFENISVDLIFAVPGQSMAELEADLDAIDRLDPEHVSLYALTFEEGTEFERRRRQGRLAPVDDELELAMMNRIEERLLSSGYGHYEISNYAKPGREARHNSAYWQGAPYLGVGPGAHSHLPFETGARRWEALRSPGAYIESRGGAYEWQEELTERQSVGERLMTAMRLESGLDVAALRLERWPELLQAGQDAEARAWLRRDGSHWVPTALGRRHADALAALFV